MKYCSNWVEIHGFTPNLTGQIRPVEFNWALITDQIG